MLRSLLIALALVVPVSVAGPPAFAQQGTTLRPTDETEATRVATRGAAFLNLQVGARAQALGGAYTAIASGVPALYWNTAATAFDERTLLGASLSNLYEDLDIQHLFAGIMLPIGINRFAVSVNQLSSGSMLRTDEEFPEGNNPLFGAEFEYTATAVGVHLSRLITDRLAFGVAGKWITEGIPGAKASFIAADFSVKFYTGLLGTNLAAALTNVGSDGRIEGALVERQVDQRTSSANVFDVRRLITTEFSTARVELPTGFRFGISTELIGDATAVLAPSPHHNLLLLMDVSDRTDAPMSPTFGLEYAFRDILYLRGGKRFANEEQINREFSHLLSFGAGVALPVSGARRILFDYAYTTVGDLDNVQTFSLELAF
ncbi:MAG: PorV/PorQ family protein [Gemmatimonadetes bacterium]|nr:PorV/PorQ family protein [Gemmatimonadota bacterium]